MKKVTVIVRTFNCDWVVDQALAALDQQRGVEIELMIVDSGSTDKTLEMVSHYPHRFIAIEPGTYFPGKVLNQAVSEAETEWVVFINSDVVLLDPYAIERLIEPLYEAKTAATFGRQVVRPEASLLVRHDYARAFPDSPEHPEWMHYSLPIAAMKKSVWETIPFYTDAWGSEDTHWGKHAKEQGYKVVYVHDAVAMHSHNYTLKQLASRRRIEGEADVYIYPGKQSSLLSAISTYIKSTLREGWHYLINGKLLGIPYLLADRFVYVWHYHQGVVHAREKKSITFGNYQKSL